MKLIKILIIALVLTLSAIPPVAVQADEIFLPVIVEGALPFQPNVIAASAQLDPLGSTSPDWEAGRLSPDQSCNPICVVINVWSTCARYNPPYEKYPTAFSTSFYYNLNQLTPVNEQWAGYMPHIYNAVGGPNGQHDLYQMSYFNKPAGTYRARWHIHPQDWWSVWLYDSQTPIYWDFYYIHNPNWIGCQ